MADVVALLQEATRFLLHHPCLDGLVWLLMLQSSQQCSKRMEGGKIPFQEVFTGIPHNTHFYWPVFSHINELSY